MSLKSWFQWLLSGRAPAPAARPLRLPTLADAASQRPCTRTAQGHWFLQVQRMSAKALIRAWTQCARDAQQRWLIIDPLSRLTDQPRPAQPSPWLWGFSPQRPEDIPDVLGHLSVAAFDAVLILDLERMRGVFGDDFDAIHPLWDAVKAALQRHVAVVQLQVLRWHGCRDDDLIPVEEFLGRYG
jgi:hypothetical protein